MFALLKPTFSLPLRPLPLARVLHSKAERSPTDVFLHPTASAPFIGGSLSPVHLRRKSARSVSYYALFQGWLLLGKPPGFYETWDDLQHHVSRS
ncbi:hypothetical protein CTI12_AA035240 [Artemisia annua]|uniref:Uncharacterized protein n=1 Tax=Artemisia annua TaxID=35608 RepID=A0A2U1QG06_ARTAN|nr:hypothetical protein CTI12_AA035240 [Artemisia annua]